MDAYHSCYTLAGLSSAQHFTCFVDSKEIEQSFPHSSALLWTYSDHIPFTSGVSEEEIFDPEDRVKPIHPIYVIPWTAVEQTHSWAQQRERF